MRVLPDGVVAPLHGELSFVARNFRAVRGGEERIPPAASDLGAADVASGRVGPIRRHSWARHLLFHPYPDAVHHVCMPRNAIVGRALELRQDI